MAAWPSTLPAPGLNGYRLMPEDQTVRTDMEVGAPRVRRRTRARNDHLNVTWTFDAVQMQTFRNWFDDDLGAAGGAAWFTLPVRLGEAGVVDHECRFIGPVQADYVGDVWRVSARLEVR